jgi:peroxiredoxin
MTSPRFSKTLFFLPVFLTAMVWTHLEAQERPAPPSTVPNEGTRALPLNPTQQKFDAAVRAVEQTLRGAPNVTVKVESDWHTEGITPEAKGTNHVTFLLANPGKLRLEASPGDDPTSKLTVVWDGNTLIRHLAPQNLYAQSTTRQPYDELLSDALTHQTLEGSGAEFLIRPQLHGTLMAQMVRVEDLGVREEKGRKLQGYHCVMATGREVELYLLEGRQPLPVAIKTTLIIPVDENKKFRMTIQSRLNWDLQTAVAPSAFAASVPSGSRRVADLLQAMTMGDSSSLVGQPAPRMRFESLDGGSIELPGDPGDDVIVLYFFATWAAPSVTDIPNIQRLRDEYTKRGVKFVPVNVGESPETLKAFLQKTGIRSAVFRDPRGEAIAALRTTSLPTVVIIRGDRTIHATHAGAQPETKQKVREDLDKLLSTQRVSRRP